MNFYLYMIQIKIMGTCLSLDTTDNSCQLLNMKLKQAIFFIEHNVVYHNGHIILQIRPICIDGVNQLTPPTPEQTQVFTENNTVYHDGLTLIQPMCIDSISRAEPIDVLKNRLNVYVVNKLIIQIDGAY